MSKKPNQLVVSRKEIGVRVRLLRQQQGLTQVELAKGLDMTQSNLSAIERGARGVTVHQVVRLALGLRASTDEILRADKAPLPGRRPSKRLMKRLLRLVELPDRDRRIVLQLLDGFITHNREKLPRRAAKVHPDSRSSDPPDPSASRPASMPRHPARALPRRLTG
jgi:transcriptional regulator with XRE-family HTH domain